MLNISKEIKSRKKELEQITAGIFELLKKGEEKLVKEKFKEAISKMAQIYYLKMYVYESDLKMRSEYKQEKIDELMKEFNQDKIKLAHIIDELSAK
ncbi:MAG: hypothetical protein ABID45_00265 [Patescibacteria group bacterium]